MNRNRSLHTIGLSLLLAAAPATFAAYQQSEDLGELLVGDTKNITANPPGTIVSGQVDQAGGLGWKGGPKDWIGTVPVNFAGAHQGKFSGAYTVAGVSGSDGSSNPLTWEMTTNGNGITINCPEWAVTNTPVECSAAAGSYNLDGHISWRGGSSHDPATGTTNATYRPLWDAPNKVAPVTLHVNSRNTDLYSFIHVCDSRTGTPYPSFQTNYTTTETRQMTIPEGSYRLPVLDLPITVKAQVILLSNVQNSYSGTGGHPHVITGTGSATHGIEIDVPVIGVSAMLVSNFSIQMQKFCHYACACEGDPDKTPSPLMEPQYTTHCPRSTPASDPTDADTVATNCTQSLVITVDNVNYALGSLAPYTQNASAPTTKFILNAN